jgi:uncharacterized membrane protein YgcG
VALLDHAFGDRERLTLRGHDMRFAEAWNALGDRLAAWEATSGLWDPAGDRRRMRARVFGVIFALFGLVSAFLGGVAVGWWDRAWQVIVVAGAVVAGGGLAAVIRAWELRIRTPTGSDLWLRVESFRRFLAQSAAHQADEASQRGQLGLYTAWAVALGEIDRWSRAVAASTMAPSRHMPMFDAATVRNLLSATWQSSTLPSGGSIDRRSLGWEDKRSGDGDSFGDGGFNGGGGGGGSGGGGGGGSW